MKLIRQLIWFAFAGVVGFAFDAGVLYWVKGELGLYWGRAVSFLSAVVSTWVINRSLTFRQHQSGMRLWHEFLSYLGLMLGGGAVNYLAYAFLVASVGYVAAQPVWGVAAGSLAGMTVNFTLAKILIFRRRQSHQKAKTVDQANTIGLTQTAILSALAAGVAATLFGLASLAWGKLDLLAYGMSDYYIFWAGGAGILIAFAYASKRSLLFASVAFGLAIALAAGGLWPVIMAVWFGLSSLLLGRQANRLLAPSQHGIETDWIDCFLLGAGIYGTVVGLLAHFPVNYPWLHGLLLALPLLCWRSVKNDISPIMGFLSTQRPIKSSINWLQACIALISLAYVATAFLPEVMYDSLLMHLFVPSQMALRHQWGFDPALYAFALMPMLGDWIFAIGYMLADEAGAKLVNLIFLFILAMQIRNIVLLLGGNGKGGDWAALIFLTTPLTFEEGRALHVEPAWAAYAISGTLWFFRLAMRQGNGACLARQSGLMLGFAVSAKAVTLTFMPPLLLLPAYHWRIWRPRALCAHGLTFSLLFIAAGSVSYVTAYIISGNPVFPFFNGIFKSEYFPSHDFLDHRWISGVSWNLVYAVTFNAGKYAEGSLGTPGFQWLLLLAPSLILFLWQNNRRGILLSTAALAGIMLTFRFESYLRYVFPEMALLTALIGAAMSQANQAGGVVGKSFAYCGIAAIACNIGFFNAAAMGYRELPLAALFSQDGRDGFLQSKVPIRQAVKLVNYLNTAKAPVALFSVDPFAAGLNADALYPHWYNLVFQKAINAVNSPADMAAILASQGSDFVLLDQHWQTPQKRGFIEAVTQKLADIGPLSVRAVREELRFAKELLVNGDFIAGEASWYLPADAKLDRDNHVLQVSAASPATQTVEVKPGLRYLNSVKSRCSATPTQGRVQISWFDARMQALSTDIRVYDCTADWSVHQQIAISPKNAKFATVYASGHTSLPLEINLVSLR